MSPKAAHSPKHNLIDSSHDHDSVQDGPENADDGDNSKPSAAELAKKRAERFGIPLIAKNDDKSSEEMKQQPAEEENPESKDKKSNHMDKYRELIASSLEEGSIIIIDDIIGDSRNANLFQKVIDQSGDEKVREIIKEVVAKISADFKNDRSSIESPLRLAGFRISRALKASLPKLPRQDKRDETNRGDNKKDSHEPKKGKWTDEEWAEWSKKKEESGGWKKKDSGDWKKGESDWKSNDWNSGNKRKDWGDKRDDRWDNTKKNKSSSHDAFESDVEEFIYRNRLDKKASDIIREETKGMVTYVMDQGFDLKRYDNPSREVMLRCKDYIRMKRGDRPGNKGTRSHSARSRSRSAIKGSRSRSPREAPRGGDKSPPRGRSQSRSDSRDRYRDRSRSASV